MAERVSEDDVRYVASLARLALDASRVGQLVSELNGILGHMDVLARAQMGTDPSSETGSDPIGMPLREDEEGTSTALTLPLTQIAPEMKDGFFLVPRLATHEDSEPNE